MWPFTRLTELEKLKESIVTIDFFGNKTLDPAKLFKYLALSGQLERDRSLSENLHLIKD